MTTKVAIVTGGAGGIGKAIAGVLLKQGYKVCETEYFLLIFPTPKTSSILRRVSGKVSRYDNWLEQMNKCTLSRWQAMLWQNYQYLVIFCLS